MEQRATSGPFSSALYSTLPIPVSLDAKEFISPPLTNEFTSPPLTEKSIPLSLPNEFISPSLTNDFISPSLTNDSVSSFLANDFTSPSLFLPNLSPVQFTSDDLELDLHYNEVPYKSEKTDKIPSLRPPNDYNVNFVRRLYDMVTDSRFQHLISWSLDGSSFLVKNTPTFAQMVLPAYFRNTRLNDFRRQLYKYGFHVETQRSAWGLKRQGSLKRPTWKCSHPRFLRGRLKLLDGIKPNGSEQQTIQGDTSDVLNNMVMLQASQPDIFNLTLHKASQHGKSDVVSYLLNKGADIDSLDEDGLSALFLAGQYPEVINTLIHHGASITARNTKDRHQGVLHHYASLNQIEALRTLLNYDCNIHTSDIDGNTALHYAATSGHKSVVDLLINHGSAVGVRNNESATALHLAAQHGHKEVVYQMIEHGAIVDAQNKMSNTPLHLAAENEHKETVDLLLSFGAAVDAKNNMLRTPLHKAADRGYREVVQILLDHTAYVNGKDDQMDTALHMAVRNGHEETAQLLLEYGADIDARNNVSYTPLHVSAGRGCRSLVQHSPERGNANIQPSKIGDVQMAMLLLGHGANIDALDINDQTPLIVAAKSSYLFMVSLLTKFGAEMEAADNHGLTATHWSAKLGNVAVLDLLLYNGAQTEARTVHGNTALHLAAEFNHSNVVNTLLENNANIEAKNVKGKTPIQVALLKHHVDIARQLTNARPKKGSTEYKRVPMPSLAADVPLIELNTEPIDTIGNTDEMTICMNAALSKASQLGQADIVPRLLDDGADIDAPNDDGLSPLFLAGQYPQVVSVLVNRGACIEARNQHNRNLTVLHYYASLGQTEALHILLNCGCNIHSTDEDDNTALHYAARKGDDKVAVLLLGQGVDINAKNCGGETALHVALENEFLDLPNLLIDGGIDIDATTFEFELTALHIAIETKNSEMISLLVKRHANVNAKNTLGQTALHLAVYSELEDACAQLIEHDANVNSKDRNNCTALHAAVERCNPALVSLLLKHGALTHSSDFFDDPLRHAINRFKRNTGQHLESQFITIITMLIDAGADTSGVQVPEKMQKKFPSLISLLTNASKEVTTRESKALNAPLVIADDNMEQPDLSDVVLSEYKDDMSNEYNANNANKRYLLHTKHKYGYGWPLSKNLQLDIFPDHNKDNDIPAVIAHAANLKISGAIPIDRRAITITQSLFNCFDARLFISDYFFMLELDGCAKRIPPKWASGFDKMLGIIREPGRLIVQIPTKKTPLSLPSWRKHIHPYLRFIDAVYVCRRSSHHLSQETFSDVVGGSEQNLATDLHAILIAGLSILSIAGGDGLIEKLVMAILDIELDPIRNAIPSEITADWRIRNRRLCSCLQSSHQPLSPVAAAKAVGIDVWRERHKHVVNRVWDIQQDKLVHYIDATDVIFVTHRWCFMEVAYHNVMERKGTDGQATGVSTMSEKLHRIRETLREHTRYVWIDTICIDKSNLSELDEAIRSMYNWYANCSAVVLDSGTSLNVWNRRGWCLQEGGAAGLLCGITGEGKLATIQELAAEQHQDLCALDLHLHYRPGNAAEILARMDARITTRVEDMAYALAGVFSIHLALAYGEGIQSRERLLHELATQKGDLSFLSFQSIQTERRQYLPAIGQTVYSIANCTITSIPISVSHLGICFNVQLVQGSDASYILQKLSAWKHLKFAKDRFVGLEDLFVMAELLERQRSTSMALAIVHEIKSLILVHTYNEISQSSDGIPIKHCYRLQCCQIEENEFGRLFNETKATFEKVWLGDQPNDAREMIAASGQLYPRAQKRKRIL